MIVELTLEDYMHRLRKDREIVYKGTKNQCNSMRIMLRNKFVAFQERMDKIGYLENQDTNVILRSELVEGGMRFWLGSKVPKKLYQIIEEPNETLPTDLAEDQSSSVQHRSTDSNSSQHETNVDPSSAQGEDYGHSNDAEDWGAHARSFIDAGRTVPEA